MKLLTIIILWLSFLFLPLTGTASEEGIYEKSTQLKEKIEIEIEKGKIYTQTIEIFIQGISHDQRKLNTLLGKVLKLESNLEKNQNTTIKQEQLLMLVNYIKYQIYLQLTPIKETGTTFGKNGDVDIEEIYPVGIKELNISPTDFDRIFYSESPKKIKEILLDSYSYRGFSNSDTEIQNQILFIQEIYTPENIVNRNSKRIEDLNTIKIFIEEYYSLNKKYPGYTSFHKDISTITNDIIPSDFLSGYSKDKCRYGYFYETWDNNQNYRISSCLENTSDSFRLREDDGGIDPYRYELGNSLSYDGIGVDAIQNSDIYYFSLVNKDTDGGVLDYTPFWVELPNLEGYTKIDEYTASVELLKIEHKRQNPWIYKNQETFDLMNIIASSLDNYFLNGDILEVIEHRSMYAGENISVKGKLTPKNNYKVGNIKYNYLGLKEDIFKDTFQQDFLLAYANTGWGQYQILGRYLQKEDGKNYSEVAIRGTYSPKQKTLKKGIDYNVMGTNKIALKKSELTYDFLPGETINNTYDVMFIDYENNTLELNKDITTSLEKIIFDEPDGLIFHPLNKTPYVNGELIEIQ